MQKAKVKFVNNIGLTEFIETVDMVDDPKDKMTIRYIQGKSISWVNGNVSIELSPESKYLRVSSYRLEDATFIEVGNVDVYDFSLDHPKKMFSAMEKISNSNIKMIVIEPID